MNEQVPWIERTTNIASQPALVVTGMHRSGTSATTRALSLLGAALPRNLMQPQADNQKGFWESDIAVALNDTLLSELGCSWDDVLAYLAPREAMALDESVITRIHRVIQADYARAGSIVLKDPRTALLLDPWLAGLERNRYAPRVVICVRNPLEIAASLGARNGFSTGRSLLLWLAHVLAAEKSSRGRPRVFIQYDDMLEDWRAQMRRVQAVVDFPFPRWTPATELEIDSFISPSDRHHVIQRAVVQTRADVPNWVKEAFAWTLEAASAASEPDPGFLDDITEEFSSVLRCFSPLLAEQRAAFIAAQSAAIDAAQRHESEIAVLKQEARDRMALWSDTRGALTEHQERVRVLNAALVDANARGGAEAEAANALRAELAENRERLEQLAREIAHTTAQADDRAARELENVKVELAETRLQLEAVARELAVAHVRVAEGVAEVATLKDALDTQREAHDRLLGSHAAEVRSREEHIALIENALEAMRRESRIARQHADDAATQLAERADGLRLVEDQLAASQREVSMARSAAQDAERQLADRTNALNSALAEVSSLRSDIETHDAVARAAIEATHRAYQQSRSWKLTSPVRWFGKAARRTRFLAGNFSTIAQVSGGLGNVIERAKIVYRREGVSGVAKRVGAMVDRVSEPPPAGLDSHLAVLENAQPLSVRAASWSAPAKQERLLDAEQLTRRVANASTTSVVLSFTHDDYVRNFGGVQLCAQVEQRAAVARGAAYLNIHPTRPLPILATVGEYQLAVSLNGSPLCVTDVATLVEAMAMLRGRGKVLKPAIHSMLGMAPEDISAIVAVCESPARLWIHDYLTLCPNYNLLRNDIDYCGAPTLASNACAICVHGNERLVQAERLDQFFARTNVVILAPSAFALSLWRARTGFAGEAHVVSHLEMVDTKVAQRSRPDGPIRIAYLGLPSNHKGWSAFVRLVREFGDNTNFKFFHFGSMNGGLDKVKFIPVTVSATDPGAMTKAVGDNCVDLAFIWSQWPETFCFTMFEAMAGGANILTNPRSGNVQAAVRERGRGLVLEDEQKLLDSFANGGIAKYVEEMRGNGRVTSRLSFSAMSLQIDEGLQ